MLYYVLPVKRYGPHHSITAVYWDVYTYRLIHPHNVTKAKVQRHKRSDDGCKRRVRQTHNQNEQVIGELK